MYGAEPCPRQSSQAWKALPPARGYFFRRREKVPKSARPREPQKSLSNGKFYNSREVPRAQNNKISDPFERLFVDGSKGAVKRQPHKRKQLFLNSATLRKQCGSTNRVSGPREGSPGSGPLREYPQQFVPSCVSTVPGVTLFKAELPGLEGLDLFFF